MEKNSDPFLISDCAIFVRDKLNEYLKRKVKAEGGSPTKPGWSAFPKTKALQVEEEVGKLHKGETSHKQFWATNSEQLKTWAAAMYHIPVEYELLHDSNDAIRLYIKLEKPLKPQRYGKIYLNGHYLANVFTYEDCEGNEPMRGQAVFNRNALAFDLNIPAAPGGFQNYTQLLIWLNNTIANSS